MNKTSRKISIFGSTGSIGCNCLDVIDNLNSNGFNIDVVYLSANTKIDLLAEQVKKYSPKGVVIQNDDYYNKFNDKYSFDGLEVLSGKKGLVNFASRNVYDTLVCALVGFSGFEPTLEAIKTGKQIALANKETLVAGGKIVVELAKKFGSKILPIDSEHSAILQCLMGESFKSISRLLLTASGGPFRTKSSIEINNASVKDALAHPNWKMGDKITIDSATMMNKGLEVIEAKWLFDVDANSIDVLIHPESIIHSMVEFKDGSVKAQLGLPDMKIPIQFALTYPERVNSDYRKIDFGEIKKFTFEEPDFEKFRCLKIAFDVLKSGGTYAAVMNAANEVAVDLFLKEKIKFSEISNVIELSLGSHNNKSDFSVEDIVEIDQLTRQAILSRYD